MTWTCHVVLNPQATLGDIPRILELMARWNMWEGDSNMIRSVGPYDTIEIDFDDEDVEDLNWIIQTNPHLFSGFVQECIDGSLLCKTVLSIPGCTGTVNHLLEGYRCPVAPCAATPSATG